MDRKLADLYALADQLAGLWNARQEHGFPERLWTMGALIQQAISGPSSQDADSLIRTLQSALRKRGEHYLGAANSFSFLAEMLLLYRRYPDGPPSLDWNAHLRFLIRIEDPALRMLYARESGYRGWSSVNVEEAVRSQLFEAFHQPTPSWRYWLSGEVLRVVSAPSAFYFIQTVSQKTLDSGEQVHQAEAIELDLGIGNPRLLGKLSFHGSCEAALWGSQALYVSSSEGLLRLQAGSAQLVVPSKNADCVCAPLPSPEGLVTVWHDSEKHTFRVAVLDHNDNCRWSEPLEGAPINAVILADAVITRTVDSRPEKKPRLLRVELKDLNVTATATVAGYNPALIAAGEQLLCADAMELRIDEDKLLYRNNDEPPAGSDKWRIVQVVGMGHSVYEGVSCFDARSLKSMRQWELEEALSSLLALPEGRGLLASEAHQVQAVAPRHPRPIVLGRWRGQTLGQPLQIGSCVLWLVHRNGASFLGAAAPSGESNEYVIEILDLDTGAWSFLPLNLGQQLRSMHLTQNLVIIVGTQEVLAFPQQTLLSARLPDSTQRAEPLPPFRDASSIVAGLPLAGPIKEDWAADLKPELARELLPAQVLAAWSAAADGNARFRLLQQQVEEDLAQASRWPDFQARAGAQCPAEFTELTRSLEVEEETSPPFGAASIDWPTIERVLVWKRNLEAEEATRIAQPADEIVRCARLLLYEYAMQCASQRTLTELMNRWDQSGRALRATLPLVLCQTISWLNLERMRPTLTEPLLPVAFSAIDYAKKPAIGFGLLWGFTWTRILHSDVRGSVASFALIGFLISLGVFCAGWLVIILSVRLNRKRRSLHDLKYMAREWPRGCPSLLADADGFVRFVQECHRDGLLHREGRSALQAAVAKSWGHPAVNKGQMVFISYSSKQAELALSIADGLRARGVGAILDRYDLELQDSDAIVENWIAESMMRSVTTVYLLSDAVRLSGWVHREGEWQLRMLGIKDSLVLPYIVTFGDARERLAYPRCRTIDGSALLEKMDEGLDQLAGRIVLDWLLSLRSKREGTGFGIAYRSKPQHFSIAAPPDLHSVG